MIKKRVRDSELRKFAAVVGGGCLLLFSILPLIRGREPRVWPVLLAGILVLLSALRPSLLRPLYQAWMRAGEGLGWINSKIILSVLFYVVLTPIGVMSRLLGKDPLRLRIQPEMKSYRQASRIRARESMEKPF